MTPRKWKCLDCHTRTCVMTDTTVFFRPYPGNPLRIGVKVHTPVCTRCGSHLLTGAAAEELEKARQKYLNFAPSPSLRKGPPMAKRNPPYRLTPSDRKTLNSYITNQKFRQRVSQTEASINEMVEFLRLETGIPFSWSHVRRAVDQHFGSMATYTGRKNSARHGRKKRRNPLLSKSKDKSKDKTTATKVKAKTDRPFTLIGRLQALEDALSTQDTNGQIADTMADILKVRTGLDEMTDIMHSLETRIGDLENRLDRLSLELGFEG